MDLLASNNFAKTVRPYGQISRRGAEPQRKNLIGRATSNYFFHPLLFSAPLRLCVSLDVIMRHRIGNHPTHGTVKINRWRNACRPAVCQSFVPAVK
jgi:hypothetical protein